MSYIALMVGGVMLGNWLFSSIRIDAQSATAMPIIWMLVPVFIIYFICSGLPFVPASEIGFGLLIIFGGEIAPLVVAVAAAGLITSFLVGRFVSKRQLARFLEYFGLVRAPAFLRKLRTMTSNQTLDYLLSDAPRKLGPIMLKYRYLGIVALLNIPGNAVIGGGGGIAFMAGVSGVFGTTGFIIATIIGVLPYPLFFFIAWLFGY